MPEYINPNNNTVHLVGPDGKVIKVHAHQRIKLSEYFAKYVRSGLIKPTGAPTTVIHTRQPLNAQSQVQITPIKRTSSTIKHSPIPQTPPPAQQVEKPLRAKRIREQRPAIDIRKARKLARKNSRPIVKQIVGKRVDIDPNEILQHNLCAGGFPISNNIGVGILSYNRHESLRRLVDSILRHTDLLRTTVFISDDASDDPETIKYLDLLATSSNIVVIRSDERGGVAKNTNRLLQCLRRFKYGLLLNDDVEVRSNDWEYFYIDAMQKTGMHHFIYREPNIYGADDGDVVTYNGIDLRVVNDRPHGAVLAFTNEMLEKVGYFYEGYGLYGMEHVDWSMKAWEYNLQKRGFYDVDGSHNFFTLHDDQSALPNRAKLLKESRKIFEGRLAIYRETTTKVDSISYVIPYRNINRTAAIKTVVNNIRAQRFPRIDIIMVEHAASPSDTAGYYPCRHEFVRADTSGKMALFNKSKAFNVGVSLVGTKCFVAHDADMLVPGNYTNRVWYTLQQHESCHLGKSVIYASQEASSKINSTNIVDKNCVFDRVVGYYEGGSLACTTDAYWKVGGFNEDFWGYGCEDCDFYARLAGGSKWKEDRVFDLLHLWHGRVDGWNQHHNENRDLERHLQSSTIGHRIHMQYDQLRKLGYGAVLKNVLGQ